MKSFRTFLAELTDRPYPYRWTSRRAQSLWTAVFTTEPERPEQKPLEYYLELVAEPVSRDDIQYGQDVNVPSEILSVDELWVCRFRLGAENLSGEENPDVNLYGIEPAGGQHIRILSTILAALQEFVRQEKPAVVVFSAKEPSRVKLYTTFVKRVSRYLPAYVGSGPYPKDMWRGWMLNFNVDRGSFFLLVDRKWRELNREEETVEQIVPVTSELHD